MKLAADRTDQLTESKELGITLKPMEIKTFVATVIWKMQYDY